MPDLSKQTEEASHTDCSYKAKLRALLEGLEIEHIDELIETNASTEIMRHIGNIITQFAKFGAEVTTEMGKMMKEDEPQEIILPFNPN